MSGFSTMIFSSYLISDDNKHIWIHNFKVGGNFIRVILRKYYDMKDYCLSPDGSLISNINLDKHSFLLDSSYLYIFCRNVYTKFISGFKFLVVFKKEQLLDISNGDNNCLTDINIFIKYIFEYDRELLITKYKFIFNHVLKDQTFFLKYKKNNELFIFKYEDFYQSIENMLIKMGFSEKLDLFYWELLNSPSLIYNKGSLNADINIDLNNESLCLINNHFHNDFINFNYEKITDESSIIDHINNLNKISKKNNNNFIEKIKKLNP